MPKLNADIIEDLRYFPAPGMGWLTFAPNVPAKRPWISCTVDDQRAVLVFGDVYTRRRGNVADTVNATWRRAGVEQVRLLNGSFSAVLVELDRSAVHLVSDTTGRRTCRWFVSDDVLLISPHDIPIVSSGLCPTDLDLVSMTSAIGNAWSLRGASFLKSVDVQQPWQTLCWQDGSLSCQHHLIRADKRLDASDKRGQGQVRRDDRRPAGVCRDR